MNNDPGTVLKHEYNLGKEEIETLRLYTLGFTKEEIATQKCRSPYTIDSQLKSVLYKTKVASRYGLRIFAIKLGLVPLNHIEIKYIDRV